MRTHFSEHFRPTDDEMEVLWAEAVFIFDTNILLNLYRMSLETSMAIRNILKNLEGRLFLPHQVALEFFKHREDVIAEQVNEFEKMKQSLKKIPERFKQDFSRHPCIPITAITEALTKCVEDQIAIIDEAQKANRLNFLLQDGSNRVIDSILVELDILFARSSEGSYTSTDDDALNAKVDGRFQKNLPPCFISTGGKVPVPSTNNPHHGDGRVWFQIVKHAETTKKPIIFVTEDGKANWWRTVKLGTHDRPIGPHFELIRDVESAAGKKFVMYTQEQFLSEAPRYLDVPKQTQAVDEVRQIRERVSMEEDIDSLDEPKTSSEKSESIGKANSRLESGSMKNDTNWLDGPKTNPLEESKSQEKAGAEGEGDQWPS